MGHETETDKMQKQIALMQERMDLQQKMKEVDERGSNARNHRRNYLIGCIAGLLVATAKELPEAAYQTLVCHFSAGILDMLHVDLVTGENKGKVLSNADLFFYCCAEPLIRLVILTAVIIGCAVFARKNGTKAQVELSQYNLLSNKLSENQKAMEEIRPSALAAPQ